MKLKNEPVIPIRRSLMQLLNSSEVEELHEEEEDEEIRKGRMEKVKKKERIEKEGRKERVTERTQGYASPSSQIEFDLCFCKAM